jgi:hypothetical protein
MAARGAAVSPAEAVRGGRQKKEKGKRKKEKGKRQQAKGIERESP